MKFYCPACGCEGIEKSREVSTHQVTGKLVERVTLRCPNHNRLFIKLDNSIRDYSDETRPYTRTEPKKLTSEGVTQILEAESMIVNRPKPTTAVIDNIAVEHDRSAARRRARKAARRNIQPYGES